MPYTVDFTIVGLLRPSYKGLAMRLRRKEEARSTQAVSLHCLFEDIVSISGEVVHRLPVHAVIAEDRPKPMDVFFLAHIVTHMGIGRLTFLVHLLASVSLKTFSNLGKRQ